MPSLDRLVRANVTLTALSRWAVCVPSWEGLVEAYVALGAMSRRFVCVDISEGLVRAYMSLVALSNWLYIYLHERVKDLHKPNNPEHLDIWTWWPNGLECK